MHRPRLVLAAVVAALVVLPASAHAATKTVVAGPLKSAKGVFGGKATGDVDGYSLKTVTIHVGDKVKWKFNGFHTVTFPKKGTKTIPFVIPDPGGAKYSGLGDAAGAPFWFNGVTQFDLNPVGALPAGGKTEDGSQVNGSGAPLGTPKPYTLKFTKKGTFTYICVIHPGMRAKVKVVAKGKKIPTAKQDKKTAAKIFAAEVKAGKKQQKLTLPAATVQGGNDKGDVVQLRFFPQSVHVPVGGSVKFQVKSLPEAHTFSFGPADYLNNLASNFVVPTASALVFNGQLALPSDPPPTLPPYDGTAHGNGFLNTGALDGDPGSPQPSSASVTFSKAGTYAFICLIHPFMQGTVVVG